MSDEKDPPADAQPAPDAPQGTPPPSPKPESAAPLEVMPGTDTGKPGEPGSALVVPGAPGTGTQVPPPPPTPIDYAMPTSKTWIPSPALIRNLGCIFKMLFGFTVLLILGYVMLMALNPKARQWALQGSQPQGSGFPGAGGAGTAGAHESRGPTPFKTVNQILALPAQALAKTDDVVKANNARAGVVDNMVAEEEAKGKNKGGRGGPAVNPFAEAAKQTEAANAGAKGGKTATKGGKEGDVDADAEAAKSAQVARIMALQEKLDAQAASGKPQPKADAVRPTAFASKQAEVLAPVTLPGGIVIQGASPEGAPAPTRAFLYWVVSINVSGINPQRLLINNRLAQPGQEVNVPLAISLEQIDAEKKLLVFKDATGAVVTRSY